MKFYGQQSKPLFCYSLFWYPSLENPPASSFQPETPKPSNLSSVPISDIVQSSKKLYETTLANVLTTSSTFITNEVSFTETESKKGTTEISTKSSNELTGNTEKILNTQYLTTEETIQNKSSNANLIQEDATYSTVANSIAKKNTKVRIIYFWNQNVIPKILYDSR